VKKKSAAARGAAAKLPSTRNRVLQSKCFGSHAEWLDGGILFSWCFPLRLCAFGGNLRNISDFDSIRRRKMFPEKGAETQRKASGGILS
jgi:hypothetical protein